MQGQATAIQTVALFDGEYVVARPQRLEIRLFGTRILAEGIAGIVGAIVLVGLILITYFRA
jgi:tetrahydromethanopterin S-methyltransferase subunit F